MRPEKKHTFFVFLLFYVMIAGNVWAANRADSVKVEGNKLSVYSEGVPLGKLLKAIESETGVHFQGYESVAERKVFLDFKGLPLSEGIKRMIFPLNCAAIYDDTGKLCKVVILEQWKRSEMEVSWQGENDSIEGPKPGQSDSAYFTPEENSHSSPESKNPPFGKRPVYLNDSPVNKAHPGNSPPDTQDEIPEGFPVPSVAGSVHLPIPDSKGAPVEVPPVGKADSGGTPPDSQNEIPENLPIPGLASSEHLPIPDS